MGFTEALTIIFVVCKLLGIITWSWWLVLLPEIIAGVLYISFVLMYIVYILLSHYLLPYILPCTYNGSYTRLYTHYSMTIQKD